jgi:RNA-splicing ligase RtcB
MEDEDGRIWVGVHVGSSGFGHKTASGFLALAQSLPFEGRAAHVLGDPEGCTPARPGLEDFVGGSMGDESVILEGVEAPENEQAPSTRPCTVRDG